MKFNLREIKDHLDDEDYLDELETREKIRRKPKEHSEDEAEPIKRRK